jgi:signal transduction histidine kinase
MNAITRSKFWPQDPSNWATYVVSIVSIISTLGVHVDMPLQQKLLFLVLCVAYTVLMITGTTLCERLPRTEQKVFYFVGMSLAGSLIFYLSWGTAWLMLLPIAAQTTYFFAWQWVLGLNLLILVESMWVVRLLSGDWAGLVQSGVAFVAAQVFVVIFTQIAAREEKAREEVQRLADELSLANQKLRQYAAQVEEVAILQERNRLARDIHDSLGHYLTALNMQIKAAQAVMPVDVGRAQDALNKAQNLAQDALSSVRRSVTALREEPALRQPLPDALASLLDECRQSGLIAGLDVQGGPRSLPSPVVVTLYRAAQEALTNVRKHALASRVDVILVYLPECVRLTVADNGVGAQDVLGDQSGFGLLGLRERVALLGGRVNIITTPQQGFTLEVEVGTCEEV